MDKKFSDISDTSHPPGHDALLDAIALCDTQAELARRLGVTPMTITLWKRRGVPVDRCRDLEEAVNGEIPREVFRPDHFRISGPSGEAA